MENSEHKKDYFLKEIDIIQDIIKRMAANSFLLKRWAIAVIIATLLFKVDKYSAFIAFIPLISFWYLDAYFLRQERLYRELYKWVITNRLNTDEFLFDMNSSRFNDNVKQEYKIMFSKTLFWFYGSIAILVIAYTTFLLFKCFLS